MFANYKIDISTLNTTSATTINIPLNIDYQLVDNGELIETKFTNIEKERSVNQILDYDKARLSPINENNIILTSVIYNLSFLDEVTKEMVIPSYYSTIGVTNDDIKFEKNTFKQSFLRLRFYDSDNPLTQNLVSEIQIYNRLNPNDFYTANITSESIAGKPLPANQIGVNFVLSNPLIIKDSNCEGYYIYHYKDELVVGESKVLYMKGMYFNAKTGKYTNMMTSKTGEKIDKLVNKLYTKYHLHRDQTGYFYSIDPLYSENVKYNQNNTTVLVDLYQIKTI